MLRAAQSGEVNDVIGVVGPPLGRADDGLTAGPLIRQGEAEGAGVASVGFFVMTHSFFPSVAQA